MGILWADFHRIDSEIPDFSEVELFSKDAYNSISMLILGSLYKYIEMINKSTASDYSYDNIALILYVELQRAACTHYFGEYERINDFGFPDQVPGKAIKKRAGFSRPFFSRLRNKVFSLSSEVLSLKHNDFDFNIGWSGNTTVPWSEISKALNLRNIKFSKYYHDFDKPIPNIDSQVQQLNHWASRIHNEISIHLGISPNDLSRFNIGSIISRFFDILRIKSDSQNSRGAPIDLLVTGTLGNIYTRIDALAAQKSGIPVALIHHGGHYFIFDEPNLTLYEHVLPDHRITYGSIKNQSGDNTNVDQFNLAGKKINYYSRGDSNVRNLFNDGKIVAVESLQNLQAVYFSGGVNWQNIRWGPFRDVNPTTYLNWQTKLLDWLLRKTGKTTYFRAHPKRGTTRFDPKNALLVDGDMKKVIALADIFVIDYPTTSLAYICATNKPVFFFDVGLRNLYSPALENIKQRCQYSQTNLQHPEEGFSNMEQYVSKKSLHSFVDTYCLPDDMGVSEVDEIANGIMHFLD